MDAWIDCMTGPTILPPACQRSMPRKAAWSRSNLMESMASLNGVPSSTGPSVDYCAFVNWLRIEVGEPTVLALSYYRSR
jgi:hypothetical protein